MVAEAVRIRVCTGLSIILRREAAVLTHDFEGLGLAHLAREFLDLAVGVRELDRIAGFEEVQALANARQLTNGRQISDIQRHAAKNGVKGVVSADEHFDCRRAGLGSRSGARCSG